MPCNSDYMNPSHKEKEMSVVAMLLDELDSKPSHERAKDGYHPRIYCKSYDADALVAELCEKLQKVDVTEYSLEMQIWWRDHKQADKERIERELSEQEKEADRQAALAKLTDYERSLLGI